MQQPVITIDSVHQKIHEHNGFVFNYLEKSVPADGFVRLRVKANNREAHITIIIETTAKCYFKTFANATFSDLGTAPEGTLSAKLTLFNRSTQGPAPVTETTYNPTVSDFGSLRGNRVIPGGTGPLSTGGTQSARLESHIEQGDTWLIEIQNKNTQPADIGIVGDFYEVTE